MHAKGRTLKNSKVESPYRKVETHTWEDDRFLRLSALPPCGQGLWLYLLTNPYTVTVPGLFCAGRAAMAEALGWEQEAFDEAFAEVFAEGMVKADWKARVVWLPNSLRPANAPESPNVAVAWRKACDRIPECELKAEAIVEIRRFLKGRGDAFLAAFDRDPASPKPTVKPSGKTSPKPSLKVAGKPSLETLGNQEQEQETAKEKTHTPRALARGPLVMRRRLHAAYEWDRGCVPQDLHAEFVAKLGGDDAESRLLTMYVDVASTWPSDRPVDNDYPFWRARFAERFVAPTQVPRPAQRAAGDVPAPSTWSNRAWRCHHGADSPCSSRTACELRTAREVGEGLVRLEDVPESLQAAVRVMASAYGPQAVQA